MAQVTLRDLATNEDIVVPPEGYIFGRVGGDADIQLEDNSISRRQARVSLKGGMWLFETLAVPQGTRPPRPVQLQEGATFIIGQAEFEVVAVEADEEEQDRPEAATIAPGKGRPGPAPVAKKAPAPSNAKTAASAPPPKKAAPAASAAKGGGEEEAGPTDIKALFAGVPKGIAYYLVNVPKLLVNPFGTVKSTIEELPNEPLGRTGLIGYALPSMVATGVLGAWGAGLAALIGPGHVFSLMSFLPIPALIGAVIGAVVTGFIFHPVFKWIINFLKGESDARSRSNYFLQMQTVSIVLAVPTFLGQILGALPVPFIGLVGPLLSVVATLATLYVVVQWFTFFKVVKWFKTVILVLGALSVLGAAYGFVMGVVSTIRGLGSGGGSAPSAEVADAVDTDLGEMPTDPEELKEWTAKRQAQLLAKAAEQQKKALAAAKGAKDDAEEAAKDEPEKDAPEPKAIAAKDEPKAAAEKDEPKAAPPPPEPVKDTPPAPKAEAAAPVAASGAYGTFARRRDAVEKLFESDPTVLQKSAELQSLYADYLEEAYELDKKYGKETSKKPERARLNQRLKEAELFQKTGKTVDALAGKLGIK